MSPSASPAKDCPRITVKTPTTPVTIATAAPTASATWTASLSKKPGAKTKNAALTRHRADFRHARARRLGEVVLDRLLAAVQVGVVARAGDDQHAAVDVDHVDVVAVEAAEHVGPDHLLAGAAGGAAAREVDDPVHHRQQRVDLVGGDQDGDAALAADPGEQRDDLAGAAQVEVRERLVGEQQARAGDQRVGDQDPLLLAAGEAADAGVGEGLGADRGEHLLDQLARGGGG